MLTHIALLAPLFVALFWSLVFFIQHGKKDVPKIHLGIFMALGFMLYFSHAVFFSRMYRLYVALEFVYLFSMLTIYPAYFLYLELLAKNQLKPKEQLFHFLPGIVFSLFALATTLILSPEERLMYANELLVVKNLKVVEFKTWMGIKTGVLLLARITLLIQVIYYVFKGISLINQHNQKIVEYYSNTEGKTLNWARLMNIVILLVALMSISLIFIGRSYFVHHEIILLVPSAIITAILFTIGFKGNQQTHHVRHLEDSMPFASNQNFVNEQHQKLKAELIRLFEIEKVHTIPDLRIVDLSGMLGTNRTYISKLINEDFQMNFNEFVNHYRIEAAKQYLKNPEYSMFKLEVISRKSGFSNMNSFNRIFKALCGTTPGNYRNSTE